MIDDDELDGEGARKTSWTAVAYRWLFGIGTLAVLVFGGVYLVYSFGSGETAVTGQGGLPLVRAAHGPVKVRPEKPGGFEVPHQKLRVYRKHDAAGLEDLLAPGNPRPAGKKAERPKGPVIVAAGPVCRLVPTLLADAGRYRLTALKLAASTLGAPKKTASRQATERSKRAGPKNAGSRPAGPKPAGLKTAGPKAATAARKTEARSRKPAGKDRSAKTAGSFRIQLGAFRTLAKARNHGRDLQRQHSSLLGRLNLVVERVDLGSKGIFYRLRAGPIRNKQAARSLCRTLGKRRVNCFLVSG